VRRADAPPAGWYPDPQVRARLRWWDGTDWSDEYRAPPTRAEQEIAAKADELQMTAATRAEAIASGARARAAGARADSDEIIAKVREAARSEVDRAADVFSQRAQAAARQIQPLVTEYTNKALRWIRIIAVVVLILLIGWITFQAVAQVSFFEWIGDRIDNLTD
jgi:flagellar biosynthesis/type III secretory pathway protein FliH